MTGNDSFYKRRGKRSMDLLIATIATVLTGPLTLLTAILVRATSGRPVLFEQERAGRNGEPFWILKFRTMKLGTEKVDGGYPTPDMVTPVGRWLRKTSLDELPQLLNILKGNMSLVGPRPALLDQAARYTPAQRERLTVMSRRNRSRAASTQECGALVRTDRERHRVRPPPEFPAGCAIAPADHPSRACWGRSHVRADSG